MVLEKGMASDGLEKADGPAQRWPGRAARSTGNARTGRIMREPTGMAG